MTDKQHIRNGGVCPICKGCGKYWHVEHDCPAMTDEERKLIVKHFFDCEKNNTKSFYAVRSRLLEQVEFWRGKFREVKHENNKLRRRIQNKGAKP